MKNIFDNEEQKKDFTNKVCPSDFGFPDPEICGEGSGLKCAECLAHVIEMEVKEPSV